MKRRRSNTLVALSSVAVMSVYTAGFMRTRAAAARLEGASRARVPVLPVPAPTAPPVAMRVPAESPALAPAVRESAAKPVAPKTPQPAERKTETKAPEAGLTAIAMATTATTPEPVPVPPPAAKTEAPAPVAAPATPAPPVAQSPSAEILLGGTELHDGTFYGWGTSRHGDIQASVTILSGRITAVSIAQCRTRYSCDVIAHLPGKVLRDQTPEKINNVSGATQSVDAFYYAVVDAMNKAK